VIVIETNQEYGNYTKQSGTLACESSPSELTLPGTSNFEPVPVRYGPRLNQA
jgi:hypothetical protein